jgi:hypothetical protein
MSHRPEWPIPVLPSLHPDRPNIRPTKAEKALDFHRSIVTRRPTRWIMPDVPTVGRQRPEATPGSPNAKWLVRLPCPVWAECGWTTYMVVGD